MCLARCAWQDVLGKMCLARCAWQDVLGARCAWQDVLGKMCLARCAWQDVLGKMCLARCAWQDVLGEMCLARCAWRDVLGEIESDGAHLVQGRLLEWALTPPLWHAEAVGGRPHGVIAGASRPIVPTVSEPAWRRRLLFRS